MAHKKLFAVVAVAATAAAMGMTGTAAAASTTTTTVLVTQNNIVPLMNTVVPRAGDTNWYVESRGSGAYAFVNDYGAPVDLGPSSLQLTTGVDDAKVKPMTNQFAGTALSQITTLGYQTYQPKTGKWEGADAAFQLRIDPDGDLTSISDETTLVYEPYLNGTIQSEIWQSWDVLAESFWSTRASDDLVAGNGGSTMYTLQQVLGFYPKAAVLGIGVNVGGNNANYTVSRSPGAARSRARPAGAGTARLGPDRASISRGTRRPTRRGASSYSFASLR